MAKSPYKVLVAPVVTERAVAAQAEPTNKRRGNKDVAEPKGPKYTFLVMPDANKREIRTAVEHAFNVKVLSVNTVTRKGKVGRFSTARVGKRADTKRAVVTLQPGQKIEFA